MAQFVAYNTPLGAGRISTQANVHPAELARVRSLYNPPGSVPVSVVGPNVYNTKRRCKDYRPRRMLQKPASYSASYGDDFYYRIRLIPAIIDMGNVASSQSREMHVWNAYLTTKTLTQIVAGNAEGLNITGVSSGVFQPLQWELYEVNVTEDGPSLVDATYTFDFGADQPVLKIIATRVTIIPFMGLVDVEESLEWKTRIVKANGYEQRAQLRRAPRQEISYGMYLKSDKRMRAELLIADQTGAYGAPVWWENQAVGAVAAGASSLAMDTDNTDLRVKGLVLLWQSDTLFESVEIATISAGLVTFSRDVVNSYSDALVMPLRVGYLTAVQFDRHHRDNNFLRLSLSIDEYANIVEGSYTQHSSVDVLEDPSIVTSMQQLQISQSRYWLDNGIGTIRPLARETRTRKVESQQWIKKGKAASWALRQWLYSRAGQDKPFWVATNQSDFICVLDIVAATLTIDVAHIGIEITEPFDIALFPVSGSPTYHQVDSVTEISTTVQRLVLSAAVGVDLTIAEIQRVSLLRLYRQASDALKLTHQASDVHLITRAQVPLTSP